MTKSRALGALLLSAVLAVSGLVGLSGSATAAPAPAKLELSSTKVDVKARDGVILKGTLSVPTQAAPAGGWPVVVMPGTFGGTAVDATGFGVLMAQRGYAVYAYYERGFGGSGGEVEGGGASDITDVSDVITWMLANTKSNPDKVGVTGLSYGAGIGLMAGVVDARIKGVAAMSGWADMTNSFYPNHTVNTLALQGLYLDASLFGKPSAEITKAFSGLDTGQIDAGLAFAKTRGAAYYRDTYGYAAKTPPAVFISEPYNEVVFPIIDTMKYWDAYPGKKHLELRAGDHGDPEWLTSFTIPTDSWTNAFRWMDANVAGYDTSINAEKPVLIVPRSSNGSRATERGDGIAAVSGTPKRFYLSAKPSGNDAGVLAGTPGTKSTTIKEGQEWLVRNGIPILSYGVESATGLPPTILLAGINPQVTSVWRSPYVTSDLKLRGEVKAHLELTPTAKDGTVVVHVIDADAIGFNFAVAHHPYSWHDQEVGKPFTADFVLPFNAYDFTFGHKLVVTVSTSDTTYTTANPKDAKVAIGPGSYVDVPVKK